MQTITVKEFTTNFPEILNKIKLGEKVGILQDDVKTPFAMIVPYNVNMGMRKSVHRKNIEKDHFAEVWGIWADRNIDGETLRKQAWGIDHDNL